MELREEPGRIGGEPPPGRQERQHPHHGHPRAPPPPRRFPRVLGDHVFGNRRRNPALAIAKPLNQGIGAQNIEYPRRPLRLFYDRLECSPRENGFVHRADFGQPIANVVPAFLGGQRRNGGANHQALFELPQGRVIELGFEFGLAHQDNLQELLRRGLQIRQHAQMLERLERHVLHFIDQQRHIAALFVFLDQDLMQAIDGIGDGLGGHLQPEFLAERVEQIAKRQIGMEQIDGLELGLIHAFEIGAQDGGFAQPHLAQEGDKALAFFDAVDQGAEGRLMAGAQEEKLRIGCDVKRRFFQQVKIEIHGSTFPAWVLPCASGTGVQLYPSSGATKAHIVISYHRLIEEAMGTLKVLRVCHTP